MTYTILQVAACPFPANRGTPSRILRMSEALAVRGHNVHVSTYHLGDDSIAVSDAVTIHRINPPFEYRRMEPGPTPKKPLLDLLLAKEIFRIVQTRSIDIIHGHHLEGFLSALPAAKRYSVPIFYDAHTYVTEELADYYRIVGKPPFKQIIRAIEQSVVGRADGVIAVSEQFSETAVTRGVDPADIWVVPTGTNTDTVRRLANESELTRDGLGLSEDQPVIVYTGTLTPYQGLDSLLLAMQRVSERHPTTELLLVGRGDIELYRSKAAECGVSNVVRFCGERPFDEVPGYLALGDIAVLPRTEATGMPQKLTNYMAVGLAIVAFEGSAKGLTHLENGFVVQDSDVDGFADAICKLIEDERLRNRLADGARQLVSDYEWESLVRTVEEAYATQIDRG